MKMCTPGKSILTVALFAVSFARLEAQDCHCPRSSLYSEDAMHTMSPARIFSFSNKLSIGLCGYSEVQGKDKTYSEFNLYECGKDSAVEEWDATQSCLITQLHDTLFVSDLYMLPIGVNFSYNSVPFYIHKFFYRRGTLVKQAYFDLGAKKYTQTQIKLVMEQYKKLTKDNHEHTIDVAKRLFWCYVSGSKEAGKLLQAIENKFGPFDGAISEEWSDITATYELWKQENKLN